MWVKVDDGLPEHRKVIEAGRHLGPRGPGRVVAIWTTGMCWANRNLTDGFLPSQIVRTWTLYDVRPFDVAFAMQSAGLLEPAEGGYRFHDYVDYQPTAADVKAKRNRDRERKKIHANSNGNRSGNGGDSARIPERSRARDPDPTRPVPKNTVTS